MPQSGCATKLERLQDLWHVMKLCRFNLVLPIVVGLFFVVVPNGQEVLLRMEFESLYGPEGWFFVLLLSWPITVWYWARVILSFEFPDWPPRLAVEELQDPEAAAEHHRRLHWILNWQILMPRICGVFALFMLLWAVWLESDILHQQFGKRGYLIWMVLLAMVLFTVFVWKRRPLFMWAKTKSRAILKLPALPTLIQGQTVTPLMFAYRGGKTLAHYKVEFYKTWRELPGSTVAALVLSLTLFTAIPFFMFWTADLAVQWAPKLGSASILLLAASGWTCVGAWIVYGANHYRIPIILLSVIWLVVISKYNDNHPVRNIEEMATKAEDFDTHLREWLDTRAKDQLPSAKGKTSENATPLIIVLAEGGGIRGAYWTASILTRLEEVYPDFARHIFAISAVSGGSLGAALYDSIQASSRNQATNFEKPDVRKILRADFVAPVFAMMLYPDLVQRFLPFPILRWDRAAALETMWERVWSGLDRPFDELWGGNNRYTVPGLILNSTSVEEGKRVLFSNIPFLPIKNDCAGIFKAMDYLPFNDVINLRLALNPEVCSDSPVKLEGHDFKKTLRISSAVHNSARFSFVSPAGSLGRNLHLVDGGYFDNSGATTALELVEGIEQFQQREGRRVLLIIVDLANEPHPTELTGEVVQNTTRELVIREASPVRGSSSMTVHVDAFRNPGLGALIQQLKEGDTVTVMVDRDLNLIALKDSGAVLKTHYISEVLTPLFTLYRAWSGRSDAAVALLHRHLEPHNVNHRSQPDPKRFFQFRLAAGKAGMPVGWTLSESSWQNMDEQVKNYFFSPRCRKLEDESPYDFLLRCWPDPVASN